MNGKAAQLDRWLMAIRQRAYTQSAGQVTCGSDFHAFYMALGARCTSCGAAV